MAEREKFSLKTKTTFQWVSYTAPPCYQSPYRLRCIELMRSAFGRGVYRLRRTIERAYANLTSFGGGLSPLPAWVRHLKRVWLWVTAKILINGVRIMTLNKGVTT